jgi:hypothetical protein
MCDSPCAGFRLATSNSAAAVPRWGPAPTVQVLVRSGPTLDSFHDGGGSRRGGGGEVAQVAILVVLLSLRFFFIVFLFKLTITLLSCGTLSRVVHILHLPLVNEYFTFGPCTVCPLNESLGYR